MRTSLRPIAGLAPLALSLGLALPSLAPGVQHDPPEGEDPPITVEDAISMVRIEDRYGMDREFVAISADGSRLATVVWHGDLERNVNVYSLLVIPFEEAKDRPHTRDDAVLTIAFEGDPLDQAARPIEQLTFLGDNRTIAFVGTLEGEPRQAYLLDGDTGEVQPLTDHPTEVTAYAVSDDGRLRLYAASVREEVTAALADRLHRDGVAPYDAEEFPGEFPYAGFAAVYASAYDDVRGRQGQQYVAPPAGSGGDPVLLFDGRDTQGRTPSPEELGLDQLPLSSLRGSLAPGPGFGEARPPVPSGWSSTRWAPGTGELFLQRADSLAVMRLEGGRWEEPRTLGVVPDLNRARPVVTDGRIAVGVSESLTEPPELAVHDLVTGETTILTNLNPVLRSRRYGEVEQIRFPTEYDSVSTGWLIKPVGFEPGRRYPLVVLFANETERPWDRSYLIDGRRNLSGHAAQPLAAHGFMVLFMGGESPPRPAVPGGRPVRAPSELDVVRANVEGAIRHLAERGDVDTLRVGVSGWSRSAWYTDQLLIRGQFPFAAATQIDGGSLEYTERLRPYTDEELSRIRTPLLAQTHGRLQFAYQAAMIDRLRAMEKPADLLYFEGAPHSTKQPQHRWRSLTTHIDWWRFWLQDYEDPDPAKRSQYQRWRASASAHAPS